VLAIAIYLFLDRFDLGILFGAARNDARRNEMLGRDRPATPHPSRWFFFWGPEMFVLHRVHRGHLLVFPRQSASVVRGVKGSSEQKHRMWRLPYYGPTIFAIVLSAILFRSGSQTSALIANCSAPIVNRWALFLKSQKT
jgi:hypothetical protein